MTWEHKGCHFESYLAAPCPVETWSKSLSRVEKDSRCRRPQGTEPRARRADVLMISYCYCRTFLPFHPRNPLQGELASGSDTLKK